jgi:hypothetical protein
MTTDNFCFYVQNRLIQTSQTGGQQYSDNAPFSIPWKNICKHELITKWQQLLLHFIVKAQGDNDKQKKEI